MQNRFFQPVNLKQFSEINKPLPVTKSLITKFPDQYILRMLVKASYSKGLHLPTELQWLSGLIQKATERSYSSPL